MYSSINRTIVFTEPQRIKTLKSFKYETTGEGMKTSVVNHQKISRFNGKSPSFIVALFIEMGRMRSFGLSDLLQ